MVLNNAENIMYGNKVVDRIFCGKTLVWERNGYKWVNDINNPNIIKRFQGKVSLDETVLLNVCEKPYTVTNPIDEIDDDVYTDNVFKYRDWAIKAGYDYHVISPVLNYNIFGDKINIDENNDCYIEEYNKPFDYFTNTIFQINNNKCTKIGDYSFSCRKIGKITSFEEWHYGDDEAEDNLYFGLQYIGNSAFQNTISKNSSNFTLTSISIRGENNEYFELPIYIGENAFAYSNVVNKIHLNCSPRLSGDDSSLVCDKFINIIDTKAFYRCTSITSINFFDCRFSSNSRIVEADYITYILQPYSFAYSSINSLEYSRFNIGSSFSVTTYCYLIINSYAFYSCKELSDTIEFYSNVCIESNAFDSSNLTKIRFAGNYYVKKRYIQLKVNAFVNCDNLKEVIFNIRDIKRENLQIEKGAFDYQIENNCVFVIASPIHDTIKNILIESGVPETLITIVE